MKPKPSWPFWLIWFTFYTALDLIIATVIHSGFAWTDVQPAVEGALFAATVTWLLALYKWHKADSGL